MTSQPEGGNGGSGRVSTRDFYKALLSIKDDMAEMERRLSDKIECIPAQQVAIKDIENDISDLRNRENRNDALLVVGNIIGIIIAAVFGRPKI